MFDINIPELRIGDLVAKLPIIQGGMGVGISLSGLASAVAKEGGIGVISSVGVGMLKDERLKNFRDLNLICFRDEIRKARSLTNGIIGVNIMLALTDFDDLARVALDENIDVLFMGAGLPLKIPGNITVEELKTKKTKMVPIVSSARAAEIIFKSWEKNYNYIPDAVVVEGPMAGGHLGFKPEQIFDNDYKLENIIPQVVDAVKQFEIKFNKEIPVIAAGGVFSGSDIYRFFKLGARGVQLGTRFVATKECDASNEFKLAYIKSEEKDIRIIKSPVGLPGRAIAGKFLDDVFEGLKRPFKCPWKCLKTCDIKESPYCIARALIDAQRGFLEKGFAFAGANAFRIKSIISVKDLLSELVEGFIAEKLLEINSVK